jgi:ubiquinone/menaquinone biosynthesis C-methylase UbiE
MTDRDTHLQRAQSFGDVAEAYQQARPTYPRHAVEWVLDAAPGNDVLDLAAGTGKLTRTIIAAGGNVTAVEPLDGMRAQLQAAYPDVPAPRWTRSPACCARVACWACSGTSATTRSAGWPS